MCKIIIKAETAKELVGKVSVLASKDAVMELICGFKAAEGNILNMVSVIDKTEMLSYQFATPKPADYEEGKPYMKLILKASDFCNLAGALVGENDIFIYDSKDKGTYIGIDKVSQLQIKKLDPNAVPDKIVLNKDNVVLQVKAEVSALTECLKIGSTMVDANNANQGIANAVLALSYTGTEGKEIPGTLKCYSTNGNAFTRGVAKVNINNNPVFMEKFNASLQGKANYKVSVPKKSMNNLLKLLSGYPDCQMVFSDKHVGVAIGKMTMYTFTMGAEAMAKIYDTVDAWDDIAKQNTIVVDAEAFKEQLSLLDKVIDLSGTKSPIILNIKKGGDLVIELANKAGVARVKNVANKLAEDFRIGFNPKLLISIVGSLKKGNIRLSSCPINNNSIDCQPFEISNGTVDAHADNSGIAFLLPVKITDTPAQEKKERPEKETPKADTEATEEVTEEVAEATAEQTEEVTTPDAPVSDVADNGLETASDEEIPFDTDESQSSEAAGEEV